MECELGRSGSKEAAGCVRKGIRKLGKQFGCARLADRGRVPGPGEAATGIHSSAH